MSELERSEATVTAICNEGNLAKTGYLKFTEVNLFSLKKIVVYV